MNIRLTVLILDLIIFSSASSSQKTKDSIYGFQLNVPMDYRHRELGNFDLYYEFGRPFDAARPTVIMISDAQQFFIRKGGVKTLQGQIFGNDFNVVGIVTRANVDKVKDRCLDQFQNIDWKKAYQFFNAYQYVNDIESVRKHILGSKPVYLYGLSGGGLLCVEYLSVFPLNASRVFIGSAVNYTIENELRIWSDNFWKDFVQKDSVTTAKFGTLLRQKYVDRITLSMLFQRQHFFVPTDSLNIYREKLMIDLLSGDTTKLNVYLKNYQVTAIKNFMNSSLGIPIKVREFEFIAPLKDKIKGSQGRFDPNYESQYLLGYPLMEAVEKGEIDYQPVFNKKNLALSDVEVFILSGRYDHTVDYRTQIYLAGIFKNSLLFIADDDHIFKRLNKEGGQNSLTKDFLKNGVRTGGSWSDKYEHFRWHE